MILVVTVLAQMHCAICLYKLVNPSRMDFVRLEIIVNPNGNVLKLIHVEFDPVRTGFLFNSDGEYVVVDLGLRGTCEGLGNLDTLSTGTCEQTDEINQLSLLNLSACQHTEPRRC